MNKKAPVNLLAFLFFLLLISCQPGSSSGEKKTAQDSVTLAAAEASFTLNCSGCHNFKQDAIGPNLAGVTSRVSREWIEKIIRDPQKMIGSGDERAVQLSEKYKAGMPSFANLGDEEIKNLVAFLYAHDQPGQQSAGDTSSPTANP